MTHFLTPFSSTLRGRLILLICLATVPATLFILFIAQQERETALGRAQSEASYFVDLIAREHLYQILGAKSLLRWLADRMESGGDADGRLGGDSDFLASLLSGYPQLSNIAILNADGSVRSSACPFPSGINMASYDAIRRAVGSEGIETGGYTIGPIVRKPLIHLAKSVRDRSGAVRQIVFVAVDLKWLNQMTELVKPPDQHTLLIVDRDGRVLARAGQIDPDRYPAGMLIPELSEKRRGDLTMIKTRKSAPARSFAVAPMQELPGIVVATALPLEAISRRANGIFFRMFLMLSLLTFTTGACVVILEELTLLRWLRSLAHASRRFEKGDYAARVSVRSGAGELEDMAKTFNSMADALESRHQELEETRDRLERLARHLQIAREQEAQRIARDLHDEVGQVLTSIKLDLRGLRKRLTETGSDLEYLDKMTIKIDDMVAFIREIASDLRPPVLDRMGIVSAVEIMARKIEQSSQVAINVEACGIEEPLDWLISITLYRIAQECLTNIARHSMATEASLILSKCDDEYLLNITDNGIGFLPDESQAACLGLLGMKERCRLVGGILEVRSAPGQGTEIEARIPLKGG